MAGGAMGGDDDDIITDINVTPLVDVVLVLLIILMVTATAIVSKTIPMELPTAATPEAVPTTPTTFAISIDAEGELYLDRDPITHEALRLRVRREHHRPVQRARGARRGPRGPSDHRRRRSDSTRQRRSRDRPAASGARDQVCHQRSTGRLGGVARA